MQPLFVIVCGVFLLQNCGVSAMWRILHSSSNQDELVKVLKDTGSLKDRRVADVMRQVDRGKYCKESPYVDGPMSIGYGATISAPHMHAYALEKLKDHLVEGARALDVGAGSGYLTVCMALMVGASGRVVGVEHMPELLNKSITNVMHDKPHLLRDSIIKLVGDGRAGYSKEAPYNAIHVGAAAEVIPQQLIDQLAEGGRMVIPVGPEDVAQVMVIVDKKEDGEVVRTTDTSVRFVPLTDREKQQDNYY
ncbi:protein-L-isoaspartate(D-aspartate) O-methyltransferase-like isoform X2 [Macrosteles quadrilineatus]|uniref:protein-L-isoaspartate(D-aspartate) O-methyltransferase-like isoform X2 n=1 Tax=Macrosteles quadrilineatus TaxID=74068 RepID=UPI0023E2AB17|nr:protein-L-isoaspartate(D-aspartate) O-methyltransferase-like isoform X2 [Macrosteles quadrilineatus]